MGQRAALAVTVAALAALAGSSPAAARSVMVPAGAARFEVLTPTLIRAEYAQDRRFENRPTMTATREAVPAPRFTFTRSGGWLTISTRLSTLAYRLGSGPFSAGNLRLTLLVSGRRVSVAPQPGQSQGNLGG